MTYFIHLISAALLKGVIRVKCQPKKGPENLTVTRKNCGQILTVSRKKVNHKIFFFFNSKEGS